MRERNAETAGAFGLGHPGPSPVVGAGSVVMTVERDETDIKPSAYSVRSRIEIRTIIAVVVLVLVLGGAWVLIFGSPTRHRAAIDSSNNPRPTIESPAVNRPAD